MPTAPDALLTEARRRFKLCQEAEESNRALMLLDKQFRALDQWPADVRDARAGNTTARQGEPPQPARPCLTIDRIGQPIRQVTNQQKSAHFAISVQPNGNGASDEVGEIYEGIIRRIQNRARAEAPIDWAFEDAVTAGLGWFQISTDYCDENSFDQDIHVERIANPLSVYCDPAAVKPTRTDMRFLFVTEIVPKEEFTARYPKADFAGLTDFAGTGDNDSHTWITENGAIRLVNYWRIVESDDELWELPDGQTVRKSQVGGGKAPEGVVKTRPVTTREVRWSILSAVEELEKGTWVGSRIPFFPVIGEELNVDGLRILRGMVRAAIDPQRMTNYFYSAAVEATALGTRTPLLADPEAIEGYDDIWQQANVRNYAYLPYRTYAADGRQVNPPTAIQTQAPIDQMVQMLIQSEEGIKATTGIFDPSLGNTNPREKSGRAILALQKQGESGSSNFLESLNRTLIAAGEHLVEIIPKIYDRPGRIIEVLDLNDELQRVAIGPQPGQAMPLQDGLQKFYDLKAGKYAVTVAVGKSYTTRQQEGSEALSQLIQAAPEYMLPRLGDIAVEQMDFPGHLKAAERLKKGNPFAQEQEGDPKAALQQAQAQMQQAGQMIEHLTKELNAKNSIIETDQIKAAREIEKTKLQLESDQKIEALRNQTEIIKAEITAKTQIGLAQGAAKVAELERWQGSALDLEKQARDQQHEAAMQAAQHAQAKDLAAQPPPLDPNAQSAQNSAAPA